MTRETQIALLIGLTGIALFLWFTRTGRSAAQTAGTAISKGISMAKSIVRGIRNNNPGNIRISSANWQGKVPVSQNTDGAFEQFVDMISGIRALAKTLLTYYRKHGLNTVQGLISRWAPGHENPTDAYVAHVARALNVSPAQPISMNMETLTKLARAIIDFENGPAGATVSTAQIEEGVRRALA